MTDLRLALRTWRRRPGVAGAAVAVLAISIGAGSAVFSVVDAALFKPLPVRDPRSLVKIVSSRVDGGGHFASPYHSFHHWRLHNRAFAHLAAARSRVVRLAAEGGRVAERVGASEVSADYFATLGVRPRIGRPLLPADATPAATPVAVVSDGFWRGRLGARPQPLGEAIELDGTLHVVVGVMPPAIADETLAWRDLWLPLVVDEAAALAEPLWGFSVLGRLPPGVTLEEARRDLERVSAALAHELPRFNQGWTAQLHPVRWWIEGQARAPLLLLLGGVALILSLACADVTALLLAHADSRRQVFAVRLALGAGRGRIVRQLLAECAVLAAAGAALGIAAARPLLAWLAGHGPASLPRREAIELDARVLATTVLIGLLATAGSGLLPALRASRAVPALRHGPELTRGRRDRGLGAALLVAQVALAFLVVVGAALLGRSLAALGRVDPGFDADRLLTLQFELPPASHPDKAARIVWFRGLLAELEALPGVERAALSGIRLPLRGGQGSFEVFVDGQPRAARPQIVVNAQAVSPSYFAALGIPLARGTLWSPEATWESSHSALVNQTFARRYFARGDAVGRWIEWPNGERATIAGVVGDVRQLALELEPAAEVYVPWGTAPAQQGLVLRVAGDPLAALPAARATLARVAPGSAVWDVAVGSDLLGGSYARRRFAGTLMALFGALALALAALGVAGVVGQRVAAQRRETAIRLACGARPARLVGRLLGRTLALTGIGLLIGGGGALAGARLLTSQLFGVSPVDPWSFVVAGALVVATALLALARPAGRLAGVDPAAVLRED
jgi:predicted permease